MKYGETQVFPKGVAAFDVKDGGENSFGGIGAIRREKYLGFLQVHFLSHKGAKTL